jgi:hypothetical protein
MKVNTFGKLGVSVGVAALLVGSLAIPATADPAVDTYGDLVGLGSDTTQDVMNGIALAIGDGKIASYDAVGSTTVVTRNGGTAIPRASGSGAGRDLLRVAIGQIGSATVAVPGSSVSVNTSAPVGNIDFARSSSGPPTDSNANAAGVLAFVPFAIDAVTIAVDPDSPLAVVPWILGDSSTSGSTTPSLYNAYRGNIRWAYVSGTAGSYTYVGVGALEGDAPLGSTAYAIQALLPKSGSGTRSYFIGKVGLSEANITSINGTTPNTIKSVYGVSDTPVEEHDGTAVDGDNTAIVPFSISQWVAQSRGVATDRRHDAILVGLNGVAATTGSGTEIDPYATNTSYNAMTRLVYNIVPSRELDDATSAIHEAFAGTTSLVCQQTATIQEYGFAPITSGTYLCGSTNTALRAYAGSSSSVSISVDNSSVQAGDTATVTATLGSTQWTQGGTVYVVDADDNELASGAIAVGETSVEIPTTLTEVGTTTVHAEFVPTLAGIAGSSSSTSDISVAGRATTTQLSTPTTLTVGVTKTLIAWIDEADPAGGVVTFKDGATVLGTVTLAPGEQAAAFGLLVKKASYSLSASYAPPASTIYVGSDSATKVVSAAQGTPTISIPTVKTVKSTSYPYVYVTVVGVSGAVPTGTVTIKEGTKTLVSAKTLSSSGKYTFKLPKLKKGTHKITVIYSGDALWNTVTKYPVTVKIS